MNVQMHGRARTAGLGRTAGRAVLGAALAALGMVGCAQPYHAQPVSGVSTEDSDQHMREPVMVEFLDPMTAEATTYLAETLPNLPDVKAAPTQLIFTVPQTLKIEGNIPDARIQQSLGTMRTQLQQNKAFSDSFMVISATEAQANATAGAIQQSNSSFRDPLQRTADRTKAETYDPAKMYALQGRMYLNNDPGTGHKQLNYFVEVDRVLDRTPVATKTITYNLQWDTTAGQWVRVP